VIRAVIFDLDGTLVETELLKARAYAAVSQELLRLPSPDERAISTYRRLVGNTDATVAKAMAVELGLEAPLMTAALPGEGEPWQALHRLRQEVYVTRVGTAAALRENAYAHNIEVLRDQRRQGRKVAVATSSYEAEASRVLEALGLLHELDLLVTRDKVSRPKPDPEVYATTMGGLGVAPEEALIVEDSPVGLAAAVASGARWVAVANEFTGEPLRAMAGIDQRWVAYEARDVQRVVAARLAG
jgi:HAD superfamily hydrolase (TIGR01509 family)